MKYESPQTPICSGSGSIINTSKIFRIGDKVRTIPHPLFGRHFYTGEIDTIVAIDDRADAMYPYKLKKLNMWIHPNELEHYIEEKEEITEEKVIKMAKTIAGEDAACFIVWSWYILRNRKFLVGVSATDDYYEVTYNASKDEWYIDRYSKVSNTVIKD